MTQEDRESSFSRTPEDFSIMAFDGFFFRAEYYY